MSALPGRSGLAARIRGGETRLRPEDSIPVRRLGRDRRRAAKGLILLLSLLIPLSASVPGLLETLDPLTASGAVEHTHTDERCSASHPHHLCVQVQHLGEAVPARGDGGHAES